MPASMAKMKNDLDFHVLKSLPSFFLVCLFEQTTSIVFGSEMSTLAFIKDIFWLIVDYTDGRALGVRNFGTCESPRGGWC